jgi:hypothetical protein
LSLTELKKKSALESINIALLSLRWAVAAARCSAGDEIVDGTRVPALAHRRVEVIGWVVRIRLRPTTIIRLMDFTDRLFNRSSVITFPPVECKN